MCERLAAAGVLPSHPVFRRAAAALREAAAREPDEAAVRAALAAAARVEAPVYLGRGDMPTAHLVDSYVHLGRGEVDSTQCLLHKALTYLLTY